MFCRFEGWYLVADGWKIDSWVSWEHLNSPIEFSTFIVGSVLKFGCLICYATELFCLLPQFSKSTPHSSTYLPHPSTHLKPRFCGDFPRFQISIFRTTHSAFCAHKNIINSTHIHISPLPPDKHPPLGRS